LTLRLPPASHTGVDLLLWRVKGDDGWDGSGTAVGRMAILARWFRLAACPQPDGVGRWRSGGRASSGAGNLHPAADIHSEAYSHAGRHADYCSVLYFHSDRYENSGAAYEHGDAASDESAESADEYVCAD
jgi:hypothetical protein